MARKILGRDFQRLADFVKDEKDRRKQNRKHREEKWEEIDRQLALRAKPSQTRAGDNTDRAWMSAIELPWQAGARETLVADVMRLIFQGNDWYSAHALLTDEYAERVGDLNLVPGNKAPDEAQGTKVTQDTADLIVKSVLDHFHSRYDVRRSWTAIIGEAHSYGTFVGRAGLLNLRVVSTDERGVRGKNKKIPVLIPVSIKNLYLDDSVQNALHEGQILQPTYIRAWWQKLEDLKRASLQQGRGWIPGALKGLKESNEKNREGHVELLEMEGDIVIPRSQRNFDLPNHIVTIAVGSDTRVIRLRPREMPFPSYITGVYERDQIDDTYGSSPLTRGRPIQVAATEIANRMINVAVLQAEPPVSYDPDDTPLIAEGGPLIAPSAQWKSSAPDRIVVHKIGDLPALFEIFRGLKVDYEQITRIDDPRRGAELKSHTTGFAADLAQSRSLLPTEDFAIEVEVGPVQTWLYMHFELAKKALGSGTTVFVNTRGAKGHFELTREHMPEKADFTVEGAGGLVSKRERRETFLAFYKTMVETAVLKAQMGAPLPDFAALDRELAAQFGIADAERFIRDIQEGAGGPAGQAGGAPAGPGVPELVSDFAGGSAAT